MFIRTPIYSSQPGAKKKESEVPQDLVSKLLAAMDARDAAAADF